MPCKYPICPSLPPFLFPVIPFSPFSQCLSFLFSPTLTFLALCVSLNPQQVPYLSFLTDLPLSLFSSITFTNPFCPCFPSSFFLFPFILFSHPLCPCLSLLTFLSPGISRLLHLPYCSHSSHPAAASKAIMSVLGFPAFSVLCGSASFSFSSFIPSLHPTLRRLRYSPKKSTYNGCVFCM